MGEERERPRLGAESGEARRGDVQVTPPWRVEEMPPVPFNVFPATPPGPRRPGGAPPAQLAARPAGSSADPPPPGALAPPPLVRRTPVQPVHQGGPPVAVLPELQVALAALPHQAAQISAAFRAAGTPRRIGEVTVFPEGAVRVAVMDMDEPGWRDEQQYPLRGLHATDVAGILGILTDGHVKPTRFWFMIFHHAQVNIRTPGQVRDLYLAVRGKMPSMVYVELSIQTAVHRLFYGGHDAEEAAVARYGTTRYGTG